MGCGLLVYLWDKLMVGFAFQPTTHNRQPTTNHRQPTISSTQWSVCLGMLSSACRKHRMRR